MFDVVKTDNEINREASIATARMVCPTCNHQYQDDIKTRRALCDSSDFIKEKTGANPRQVYFHGVTRLSMWWVSWGEVVGRILDAKAALDKGLIDPWRQLRQKDFAEWWDDNFVREKREIAIGDHRKDELNDEPLPNEHGRYMTVDCGKGHFWHMAMAWTKDGKGRILSEGYIDSESKLKEIAARAGITQVFVDVGWDTENLDVLAMIERNNWVGIRGSDKMEFTHTDSNGKSITKPYSAYGRTVTKYKKAVRYFFISSHRFKDDADGLLNSGAIEIPVDASENFRNHIKAEVRTETVDAKGNVKSFWKTINRNNHLWDTLYYNVAVAYIKGVFRE
jgi:hypothetical protein